MDIGTLTGRLELQDTFTSTIDRALLKMATAETKLATLGVNATRAGTALTMAVTAPLLAIGAGAVTAAIQFESSFAGVRKTTDATEEQFNELAGAFRNLAREIPISVNEINRIAEAGGQLGVAREDLIGFTRTMADMGVATNLSSDQAATGLAQIANIMNNELGPQYDRLGSTIVDLGNKSAATESDILEFGLRLSGAGKIAGLTEGEILGMGTALASVGINAEAGGTAFSKVMIELASASSTGGAKLEGFAKVAKLSASDFAQAFRDDAAGAVVKFVEGLGKVKEEGGNLFKTLEDLGITEQRMRDALLRSAGAGDLLSDSIRTGTQAWKDNNALTIEAEKRYKTTESQLILLKNKIYDVGISLGGALLPALQSTVGMVEKFIPYLESAVKMFAALPEPVQQTTLGLLAFSAAIGPIVWMIGKMADGLSSMMPLFVSSALTSTKLGDAFKYLTWPFRVVIDQIKIYGTYVGLTMSRDLLWSTALGKTTTAMGFLSGAVKGAWALFAASPVGWVVAGFGALLIGMRALTGSWEFLTKPLGRAWQALKDIWTIAKHELTPVVESLGDSIKGAFAGAFESLTKKINDAVWALRLLWNLASNVPGPIKSILDGAGFNGINQRANEIRAKQDPSNFVAYPDMPVEAFDPSGFGGGMFSGWGASKPGGKKGTGGGNGGTGTGITEEYKKALDEMRASLLTTDESVRAFRDTFANLTPTQLANVDVQRRVVDQINNLRGAYETVSPAMLEVERRFLASEAIIKNNDIAWMEAIGVTQQSIEANLRAGMSEAALAGKYGVRVTSLQALMDKQKEQAEAAAGLYEFEQIAAKDAAERKVYADQRVIESGEALIDMQRFVYRENLSSYQQQVAAIDDWASNAISQSKAVGTDLVALTALVEREAARQRKALSDSVDRSKVVKDISSAIMTGFWGPMVAGTKDAKKELEGYMSLLSTLADGFAKLAQVAQGRFSDLLSGVGQVFTALEMATKMTAQNGKSGNPLGGSWGAASVLFNKDASGMTRAAAGFAGAMSIANGAMQAWNSGSALGGAMAGAQAGAMFGPWGAAIGGVAGGLIGLFNSGKKMREENKKATATIQEQKTALLELYGSLTDIAKLDAALGTDVAAGWGHQGVIGLAAFNESAEELAERLSKIHNEMQRIASDGGLASDELRRFRDAMAGDATVQEFSLGQVRQAGGNIGGMLGSLQTSATASAQALAKANGDEEWDKVIGKITLTATGASAMASVLLAAWDGSAEGLREMQPSLDILQRAMENSGVAASEAFGELVRLSTIAADEVQGPLVDAINFGTAALTNMSNSGFLTQETFSGIVDEIMAQRAALIATGATSKDVDRLMQPSLQRIWELHKDTGMAIDDETAKLLAQSEAQGLVGDRFRSSTDRMVIALERIAEMFETVFGDKLIDEIDRGTREGESMLGNLTRDREIRIRTRYDATEGNPDGGPGTTNGGGGGTANVYVDSYQLAQVMVPAHAQVVQDYHLG